VAIFFNIFKSIKTSNFGYNFIKKKKDKKIATIKDIVFDKNIPMNPRETIKRSIANFKMPCIAPFINKNSLFLFAINIPFNNPNTDVATTEMTNIKKYIGSFKISNFGERISRNITNRIEKNIDIKIENKKEVEIILFLSSIFAFGRNFINVGLSPAIENSINKPIIENNVALSPTSSEEYKRAAINQNKNPVIPTIIFERNR